MSLERFKIAQADPQSGIDTALAELRRGRKTSHWIWYIFPQLEVLGRSSTAKYFGISGAEEAREYLREPTLCQNLILAMETVLGQLGKGVAVNVLMGGSIDSLKLVSSMTLFKEITENQSLSETLTLARINALARDILDFAGHQGLGECHPTLDALREADV